MLNKYAGAEAHQRKVTQHFKRKVDPIDVYVGARVRLARTLSDLSQEKLSDKLGITFQQVQKYENGTNRISASRLMKISIICNRPITYFFEGAPIPEGVGAAVSNDKAAEAAAIELRTRLFLNSEAGRTIACGFQKLSDHQRASIANIVEAIAEAAEQKQ